MSYRGLISRIETFEEDSGLPLTLGNYLDYCRLNARILYEFFSFSRLCERAGKLDSFTEPVELRLF